MGGPTIFTFFAPRKQWHTCCPSCNLEPLQISTPFPPPQVCFGGLAAACCVAFNFGTTTLALHLQDCPEELAEVTLGPLIGW